MIRLIKTYLIEDNMPPHPFVKRRLSNLNASSKLLKFGFVLSMVVGSLIPILDAGCTGVKKTEEKMMNPKEEVAILAGGCFWGVEELIRKLPGVLSTQVGYTGGFVANPTYEVVKKGKSGHAESIKIVFDPSKVSYRDLLLYFFRLHDPTTLNRQGNDLGTQYRSAIFYTSEEQKRIAEAVKKEVDASAKWPRPLVTEIVGASTFYDAEDYHQDYLQKNPNGYTCHYLR